MSGWLWLSLLLVEVIDAIMVWRNSSDAFTAAALLTHNSSIDIASALIFSINTCSQNCQWSVIPSDRSH